MSEWQFYQQVVEAAGCWYMVDINNIYVSSKNHDFDPRTYLEALDWAEADIPLIEPLRRRLGRGVGGV